METGEQESRKVMEEMPFGLENGRSTPETLKLLISIMHFIFTSFHIHVFC
jgi:hypothetical protein